MTRRPSLPTLRSARGNPIADDARVEFALLDAEGRIVAVNDAWLAFCHDNGGDVDRCGVGASYLDLCDRADDAGSREVGAAIRAALAGELPAPVITTIPCDAPGVPRFFDVLISSRLDDHGTCVGATVTLARVEDYRSNAAEADLSAVPRDDIAGGREESAADLEAVMEERDHIAARLNSGVMSELFSIGIGLQGMLPRLASPEDKARLVRYVDALDVVVRQVRSAVFDLGPAEARRSGLKRRLLEAIDDERNLHVLDISISFSGPLDADVGRDLGDMVVDVVRAAISCVVQRSRANSIQVSVALADSLIVVEVSDGATAENISTLGTGLDRLKQYAEQSGGTLQVTTEPRGQTLLRWTVSLEESGQHGPEFTQSRTR